MGGGPLAIEKMQRDRTRSAKGTRHLGPEEETKGRAGPAHDVELGAAGGLARSGAAPSAKRRTQALMHRLSCHCALTRGDAQASPRSAPASAHALTRRANTWYSMPLGRRARGQDEHKVVPRVRREGRIFGPHPTAGSSLAA